MVEYTIAYALAKSRMLSGPKLHYLFAYKVMSVCGFEPVTFYLASRAYTTRPLSMMVFEVICVIVKHESTEGIGTHFIAVFNHFSINLII